MASAADGSEEARQLNHTFFLNLSALAVAAVLLCLRRSRPKRDQGGDATRKG